ncbi:MAG TPA: hypothetical protein DC057_10055 [Spirochaetia bacterium]|nr:hypothetical protein [Spirochaetia bacterium]
MKYENLEKASALYDKINQVKSVIRNMEEEMSQNKDIIQYINIGEEGFHMEQKFFLEILNCMISYHEFLIKKLEEL